MSPLTDLDAPIWGPSYDEAGPALAAGPRGYLLVWSDQSRGGTYVARVAFDGTVLDPMGSAIGLAPYGVTRGDGRTVLFDGNAYAVAWLNDVPGTTSAPYFLRIEPDGGWADPAPLALGGVGDHLTLAVSGQAYLTAWDRAGSVVLHGCRVAIDGGVIDPAPLALISFDGGMPRVPALASDGARFLLAYEVSAPDGGLSIRSAWVTDQAQVSPAPTALAYASSPALAFAADHYVMAWLDPDAGVIRATRLDLDGGMLDPGGLLLPGTAAAGPSLGCVGPDCVAVWQAAGSQVASAELLGDGSITQLTAGWKGGSPLDPRVACAGASCVVSWRGVSTAVQVAVLAVDGGPSWDAGAAVDLVENGQVVPIPAPSPSGPWLVGWLDRRNGPPAMYASFVWPQLPPGPGFEVSANASSQSIDSLLMTQAAFAPAAASDGSEFLYVWDDTGNGLRGTRIELDGGVLDIGGFPIAVAKQAHYNAIATFGLGEYFVIWEDQPANTYTSSSIYGARILPGGVLLDDGGFSIAPAAGLLAPAGLAAGSNTFLVSWIGDNVPGGYVARLLPDGGNLDPGGIVLPTSRLGELGAALDFDGQRFWAAWSQSTADGGEQVCAARVDEAAGLLDANPILVATGPLPFEYPSVACEPGRCLVVWLDSRSGHRDLYGAWLDEDGGVSPPSGEALAVEPVDKWNASLATDRHGNWLLTYQEYEAAPPNNFRARARWVLTDAGTPAPDAGPAEDAGAPAADAGAPVGDAGPPADDAGALTAFPSPLGVGCGCSHGLDGMLGWAAAALLALLNQQRVRRHERARVAR